MDWGSLIVGAVVSLAGSFLANWVFFRWSSRDLKNEAKHLEQLLTIAIGVLENTSPHELGGRRWEVDRNPDGTIRGLSVHVQAAPVGVHIAAVPGSVEAGSVPQREEQ